MIKDIVRDKDENFLIVRESCDNFITIHFQRTRLNTGPLTFWEELVIDLCTYIEELKRKESKNG